MRFILIYSPHVKEERSLFERMKTELGIYAETVAMSIEEAKKVYPIRATPALIQIRDDLQGEQLLQSVDGKLRIVAEAYKSLQEEEKNLFQMDSHRLDYLISTEKQNAQDTLLEDMIVRGVI